MGKTLEEFLWTYINFPKNLPEQTPPNIFPSVPRNKRCPSILMLKKYMRALLSHRETPSA